MARGNVCRRVALDSRRDLLRRQAGRRDQQAAGQGHRPLPAHTDGESSAWQAFRPLERGRDDDRAARVLDLALKGQHIAVAVEHPALGRQNGGVSVQLRLQRSRLDAGQVLEALNAVGRGLLEDGLDAFDLSFLGRHDQLAAFPMIDLAAFQEVIEGAPSPDAELRLQGAGRIVEPAVDHLGIARGDPLADVRLLLQHQHRQAAPRQRPAAGEPHSPRAYDRRIEVERRAHGPTSCRREPWLGSRNTGSACRPPGRSSPEASCPACAT